MSDLDKFHDICNKPYKEQGVWFLNCFWEEFAEKEAETVWNYVITNSELDLENHEEGCALDEMKAHVFLEKFNETLTVREMRAKLRSTGAIGESERPKNVPLTHFLLYKYNADWRTLIDETRQGDNKEELEKAESMLAEVLAAFKESEAKAAEARNALNAAVSAENSAKEKEAEAQAVSRENEAVASENAAVQRENEAKASEEKAKQRESEAKDFAAKSAEKESIAKKDADAAKEREAEAKSAQEELEAALAALKAEEDPLPLRRAKITAEAAVKRSEKATKAAADARASDASQARQQAEQDAASATAARNA